MNDGKKKKGRTPVTEEEIRGQEEARRMAEGAEREDETLWEQARRRGKRAGERISEGWGRLSESAEGYAKENPGSAALSTFGAGIVIGLLIGILIGRD